MFSNLIESTSHRAEIKRRSSFLLFTTASYALLFVIGGVASIYAYDAKLRQQDLDLTILTFAPPEVPSLVTQPPSRAPSHSAGSPSNVVRPERTQFIDRVDNPTNVPRDVGVVASTIPPAPPNAILSDRNVDPPTIPGGNGVNPNGRQEIRELITDVEPPPVAAPTPAQPRIVKSTGVLNGKAIFLPKPAYTPIAKAAHASGTVTVQVLIDEKGQVVSAKAISGHPLLVVESQKAASQARFSPTILGEKAVKVSGVITYNFILH
jgi:protein TonB